MPQPLQNTESNHITAAHHRGGHTAAASRRLQPVRATQQLSTALAPQGCWQGSCGSHLLQELRVRLRPLRSVSRFEIYLTCYAQRVRMLKAALFYARFCHLIWNDGAMEKNLTFFDLLYANGWRTPKTTTETHSPTPLNYPLF